VKNPLIIIDDFGVNPMKSPHYSDFHDLIAEHYERGSTNVTSNLDDAIPINYLVPSRSIGCVAEAIASF